MSQRICVLRGRIVGPVQGWERTHSHPVKHYSGVLSTAALWQPIPLTVRLFYLLLDNQGAVLHLQDVLLCPRTSFSYLAAAYLFLRKKKEEKKKKERRRKKALGFSSVHLVQTAACAWLERDIVAGTRS